MTTAPWYIAGPLLGLAIVGLRAALNKPFGALGGYIDFAEHTSRPRQIGIGAFLLLGLVLGGALYAVTFGTFSPSLAYVGGVLPSTGGLQFVVLLIAGIAMGFGARTAGGCTSGHGLTGTSLGSPASIAATATFFTTAVLLAHILAAL
jgi:uncharacterized membrane protein YedE/YeeE